jgi:hypothetical protein
LSFDSPKLAVRFKGNEQNWVGDQRDLIER